MPELAAVPEPVSVLALVAVPEPALEPEFQGLPEPASAAMLVPEFGLVPVSVPGSVQAVSSAASVPVLSDSAISAQG